jgi:hypothetical protein
VALCHLLPQGCERHQEPPCRSQRWVMVTGAAAGRCSKTAALWCHT